MKRIYSLLVLGFTLQTPFVCAGIPVSLILAVEVGDVRRLKEEIKELINPEATLNAPLPLSDLDYINKQGVEQKVEGHLLHIFVTYQSKQLAVTKLLLHYGADPTLPNSRGETPYDLALARSQYQLAHLFGTYTSTPITPIQSSQTLQDGLEERSILTPLSPPFSPLLTYAELSPSSALGIEADPAVLVSDTRPPNPTTQAESLESRSPTCFLFHSIESDQE